MFYLVVTADAYELPVAEFDTRQALIDWFNVKLPTLKEALYHGRTAYAGNQPVKIYRIQED